MESQGSFLRDAGRFFAHLFPGVVDLVPSSLHRSLRKLLRFLEPLRREAAAELVGDLETLVVDSTLLLVLHARQVGQSAGFPEAARVGWDSFPVYEVKLHLCSAPPNRVPVSYEPSGQRCRNQAHRGVALRTSWSPAIDARDNPVMTMQFSVKACMLCPSCDLCISSLHQLHEKVREKDRHRSGSWPLPSPVGSLGGGQWQGERAEVCGYLR